MKIPPHNHGGLLIGQMHRPRRPPHYAEWIDTHPARPRRRFRLADLAQWLLIFIAACCLVRAAVVIWGGV